MRLLSVLALLCVLCGCATYQDDGTFVHKSEKELDEMEKRDTVGARIFQMGSYAAAERIAVALSVEPTVSRPLYQLEHVSTLLMQGRRAEAHELMMRVRNDLEWMSDPACEKKAASLWHGENNKVFKGDNHERAILYAFLAMSFIERGEWEDAERCVKNGLLADSSTVPNASYSSDFHLLHYLGYLVALRAGHADAAADYRREMGESIPVEGLADANAFLVIWNGTPPSFTRGGAYEEVRQIIPGSNDLTCITAEYSGGDFVNIPHNLADVNFQAKTRGGREMDTVLANKAQVKTGLKASGNILIIAGLACLSATKGQTDPATVTALGCVGGSCLLLGATFHVTGYFINSKADVRHWKNLPGNITLVPLHLPTNGDSVTVRGYSGAEQTLFVTYSVKPDPNSIRFFPVSLTAALHAAQAKRSAAPAKNQ